MSLTRLFGEIWQSRDLDADLEALCDCGGRFAGTPSERLAREWLRGRLAEAAGAPIRSHAFRFNGWVREHSSVTLMGGPSPQLLPSTSLVLSPATPPGGLDAEVLDLGRGTAEDFAAARREIADRAVLVRHEFPFTTGHIHRRRKYGWARDAGATAFLIANNIPGGVVTGSSGQGDPSDIPAVGLSFEGGERLARAVRRGHVRIRLEVGSHREAWTPENLYAEIPGQTDEWVILCAHYDGHDLAESAMDNGSGVVTALEVARRLSPLVPSLRRGLRIMFFTVEEWALIGSSVYVNSLTPAQRRQIALAINLDTVVGNPKLHALTGGLRDIERFVTEATAAGGVPVAFVRPVLANSDHYNFFLAGIPSFRLIAGYEDPSSLSRYLLTPADTRDKVDPGQLRTAAATTAALVHRACSADEPPARPVAQRRPRRSRPS